MTICSAEVKITTVLLASVWALSGCAAQATSSSFELSGRIGIEGTANFPQPVLVDGQGKKWILDCTKGAASALQGREVLAIVIIGASAPSQTLGVPKVCVQKITPR
ncbi:hypothetical protein [Hydrogenophaga sp.]|uniref:hypothetical protein n=1 Tax=Hydrogenophaga sp. TaxID=1904254 RepID=UPI0025C5244B|nr:hypothetical protein [Hydrogenophaga sp.]MBT9464626.1 hypothetical protein [Hydrogenophaga sp.]